MDPLVVAIAGAVAGLVAMSLPGVHVNSLALLTLGLAPASGEAGVAFLLGAMAGAPFGLALSHALFGGHPLAAEGRQQELVALLSWGAFAGILLALPLAFVARPLMVALLPHVKWVLLLVVVGLVAMHRDKWWLAVVVLLTSGALGLVAFLAGNAPLVPLLTGVFAVPNLIAMLWREEPRSRVRFHAPRIRARELLRRALPGAAASSLLGLAPGVSTSHVAPFASDEKDERRLVTLGAVNGGGVVFGLLAFHALGKARAGALVAAQQLAPAKDFISDATLVLAAAGVACLLARGASAALPGLPEKPLATAGLVLIGTAVALASGLWGFGVLFVATLVGFAAERVGVSRSVLMGVILVPAALRAWGIV